MIRNLAFLAIALTAFTGCGPDDGNGGNNGGNTGCTGADCNTSSFTAKIEATAPTTGAVTLDDAIACDGSIDCVIPVNEAGDYKIGFDCPSHLAVPQTVTVVDGDDFAIDWDFTGGWGANANGTFTGDTYGGSLNVVTSVVDNMVQIDLDLGAFSGAAPLTGHHFVGDDPHGDHIEGDVSDDLQTITYHLVAGSTFDDTLRLQ